MQKMNLLVDLRPVLPHYISEMLRIELNITFLIFAQDGNLIFNILILLLLRNN